MEETVASICLLLLADGAVVLFQGVELGTRIHTGRLGLEQSRREAGRYRC